jgi:AcrR family transcriptional regulator
MSAPIQDRRALGGPGGRPRDASRDSAVLQAVRELLAEEGYQALSVHKVTLRCGVHVRTITRRWDSKAEMVAAAILGGDARLYAELSPRLPTGRLAADVRAIIDRTMHYLADPATRAALPPLMGEMEVNDMVREYFRNREEEWVAVIRAVLERAVESGDAPDRVLGRELVLSRVIAGSAYSLQFSPTRASSQDMLDGLTAFLLAAILGP